VHSHGKGAGIFSRPLGIITRKPCVHTFHGVHIGDYSKIQKNIYLILEKILTLFTRKIIAVSESEKGIMLVNKIAASNKIAVINNGVEIHDIELKERTTTEKLKVASISRFDYQKNSEQILEILNHLKLKNQLDKFEFHLIGDGEKREYIQKKIDELNYSKNVKFHGMITNPKDVLVDMDCYLTTSRWEGLPLAVIEAMSLGLPVIGTKVTGHKEVIIDHTNGYFYDIKKPVYAAELLLKMNRDNMLLYSLSENARKIVQENFSVDRMANETASIYNQILSNN